MEALLGRSRRTSVGILALAVVVALAGAAVLAVASGTDFGQGYDQVLPPFVASQVVLLGLVAAAAYANDGLAVCWGLALVASLPGHAVTIAGPSPARTAVRVAVAALAVGTVGYVLGRGAWLRRTGEPFPDDVVWRLLVGRDAAGARRSLYGAVALGVAFFVAWAVTPLLDVPLQEFAYRTFGFPGAVALLTALAAVQAYANDGLVLSWAAAFGPAFGFLLGFGSRALDGVLFVPVFATTVSSIAAVVFGTAGFVVGAGLWRLRGLVAGGTPEEV